MDQIGFDLAFTRLAYDFVWFKARPEPSTSTELEHLQADVDEVKVIMKQNIGKLNERGENLQALKGQTYQLELHVSRIFFITIVN